MKIIAIIFVSILFSCGHSKYSNTQVVNQDTISVIDPDTFSKFDKNNLVFKPEKKISKINTSSKKKRRTQSVLYPSQCQAFTKKGYQCSRKVKSGGYCWQHGG